MFKFSIILFILTLFLFLQNKVSAQNIDVQLLHDINSNQSVFLRNYSRVISNTTTYVSVSIPITEVVIGLIEKDNDKLRNALYMGASFGASAIMSFTLKRAFNRPRPAETYPELITAYQNLRVHSFPSGHTYEAFSSATALSLSHPKWYIITPAYIWASSVGYSRLNLGVHYPSDVLAGAVLGIGSAYLTYKINKYFWKKKDSKKLIGLESYL
jgi:membrane-associated phospholipid phosphatase